MTEEPDAALLRQAQHHLAKASELVDDLIAAAKYTGVDGPQPLEYEARIGALVAAVVATGLQPGQVTIMLAVAADRIARTESFESQIPRKAGMA